MLPCAVVGELGRGHCCAALLRLLGESHELALVGGEGRDPVVSGLGCESLSVLDDIVLVAEAVQLLLDEFSAFAEVLLLQFRGEPVDALTDDVLGCGGGGGAAFVFAADLLLAASGLCGGTALSASAESGPVLLC